ncbi:MAG: metallophosphoesterase [Alphaproteobacteria bacterium]|nr:metallophosphoesterase [Alphaproteobacteria bacterium]NCQ89193.1 metallophosphoesterase [Alphaproteobacteria bacterium]
MQYLIIPDIHGQADKLHDLLAHLGWKRGPSGWSSEHPEQEIVFLGDFIDRGPNNARVISTVRDLIDSGKAHAVMGNHELNAIHFHTQHPETGQPLRAHSEKNFRQHASFLDEFSVGGADAAEAISWMRSLPLYKEFDGFRVVHACWSEPAIAELAKISPSGVLSEDQFIAAANERDALFSLAETVTKGPEVALPDGLSFSDKDGTERRDVRVKWWSDRAKYWSDIAMSVPEPENLPRSEIPAEIMQATYPRNAKPVFFGHYWLTGTPVLQSENALCLDYSAGKDGPLLAYRFDDTSANEIKITNVLSAP